MNQNNNFHVQQGNNIPNYNVNTNYVQSGGMMGNNSGYIPTSNSGGMMGSNHGYVPQSNQGGMMGNNQGYNPQYNQGNQGGMMGSNQGYVPTSNQGMNIDQNNVQQIVNMVKNQLQLCQDPMVILAESKVAYIKQQVSLMKLVTQCETQNVYDVYSRNSLGQLVYLFKCKEQSGWCERQYCRGDSRPFKMKMKHVTNPGVMDEDFMDTFAVFDRPFKCTCCCLARPKLKGSYKNENGNSFGSVTEPWTCCDPEMVVKDYKGDPKFIIHADCCQCGFMCRTSICGKCSDVCFPIYPAECTDFNMNNKIGMIRKVPADIIQELVTEADNFECVFPDNASPEEKLLLIGTVLMIDYRYYEETIQEKKNNNGGLLSIDI